MGDWTSWLDYNAGYENYNCHYLYANGEAHWDNLYLGMDPNELGLSLLEGDANHDGIVSAGDYACVQANFGNVGTPGILGDANGDGVVSAGDYACVQANFGNTTQSMDTVPEPASVLLLVAGSLSLIRRIKR